MESDTSAKEICKRLTEAGFIAYYAGGWVRDFLMGHPSADVDIATSATPEEIQQLFPHNIPVGIAFGVVIVVHKGHHFEVSTFRTDYDYSGRKPAKITHSTPEEDVQRRDFTINGMFYDPEKEEIIDMVGGQEDIKKRIIRAIGDPSERFFEDRLRMIRAVRFAARFGFHIDQETQEGIHEHAPSLFPAVAKERVFQELCKMAEYPGFDHALVELHRFGLLATIFPQLADLHLNTLKERVKPIAFFPNGYPAILALMELFPNAPLEEQLNLVRFLKTGAVNARYVEFIHEGKVLMEREQTGRVSSTEWTHFYAHPHAQLCLDIIAARYTGDAHTEFLERHSKRMQELAIHSGRIAEKKPLISGKKLMELGVSPGKELGALMKEAESLAITHDLHETEPVLELLKKSPNWPKKLR